MKEPTAPVFLCLVALGLLSCGSQTTEEAALGSALSGCKRIKIYSYAEDREIVVSDPIDIKRLRNTFDRSITDESNSVVSFPEGDIALVTFVFVPDGKTQDQELVFGVYPGNRVSFLLSLQNRRVAEIPDFCNAVRLIAQKNGLLLGVDKTE